MPTHYEQPQLDISSAVNAQLHRDIESKKHKTKTCAELVALRRDFYGGKYLRATQNRHLYLKKLKKENVKHYWIVYNEAVLVAPPTEEDIAADEEVEYQEEEETEETKATPSKRSTKRSTQRTSTPCANGSCETPQRATTAETPSSKAKMQSSTKKKKATPVPTQMKSMFKSLEDAEDLVDESKDIDFDYPEACGHNLLFTRNEDMIPIQGPNAVFVSDEIEIMLQHLMDMRDFDKFKLLLVLNGTAFFLRYPKVCAAFIEDFTRVFETKAQRGEDVIMPAKNFGYFASAITQDSDRNTASILFILPEGVVCTTDYKTPEPRPPTRDQLVKFAVDKVKVKTRLTSKKKGSTTKMQTFKPGTWKVRVVSGTLGKQLNYMEEEEPDIADIYKGNNGYASSDCDDYSE